MTRKIGAPQDRESLNFEYELDAPPARVWRALTIPEYVSRWLSPPGSHEAPGSEGASAAQPRPTSLRMLDCEPNRSVRYAWREDASPLVESIVTFRLRDNEAGGTTFSIVHELHAVTRLPADKHPANSNIPRLLLAA
jgi:uncharacterized protein YndB with AHSA1/START domain